MRLISGVQFTTSEALLYKSISSCDLPPLRRPKIGRCKRACRQDSHAGSAVFWFNFEAPLKLREKTADHRAMSTGSINNLSSGYLEALSGNPVGASSQTNSSAGSIFNNAIGAAVILDPKPQTDNSQLSPFAQVLNTLQQLQQTNPTEYQQVTQQIATNLQSAAQTAQSQGTRMQPTN
jgi:hypothetical protein